MVFAALLALVAGIAPGTVVVGAPAVDGSSTTIRAIAADGAAHDVAVVQHRANAVPRGVLEGQDLLLVVERADMSTAVVRVSLASGTSSDEPTQPDGVVPTRCFDGQRTVVEREVTEPIVRKALADVRAHAKNEAMETHAALVDAATGETIARSVKKGMSPACGDDVLAYTKSAQDGTFHLDGRDKPVRAGKKGIARPQQVARIDGRTIVVVLLAPDAKSPGALVRVDVEAKRATPIAGAVVYGIVHAAP